MLLIIKIVGLVVGIYILTVLALLALIRIRKLDSNSWHFKMAYPYRKSDLREHEINVGPYFAKLVFMLYVGWPWIIVCKIIILLVAAVTFLLFGWLSPNLKILTAYVKDNSKSVNLVMAWLAGKKKRLCRRVKVI